MIKLGLIWIEIETPKTVKDILFPIDVWVKLKGVKNEKHFQRKEGFYNLGFMGWRIIQAKF